MMITVVQHIKLRWILSFLISALAVILWKMI